MIAASSPVGIQPRTSAVIVGTRIAAHTDRWLSTRTICGAIGRDDCSSALTSALAIVGTVLVRDVAQVMTVAPAGRESLQTERSPEDSLEVQRVCSSDVDLIAVHAVVVNDGRADS